MKQVVVHATVEQKEGQGRSVLLLVYTAVMKGIASVAHAGQSSNAPDSQADESRSRRVVCGERERKKFSTRRGRTTLTEPLQSHFVCL